MKIKSFYEEAKKKIRKSGRYLLRKAGMQENRLY